MGSNKQKKRQRLLKWLFAINFFMSVLAPFQCMALGLDTYIPPTGSARRAWNRCDLGQFQTKSRNKKWWKTPLEAVFDASVAVGEQTFDNVAGGAQGLMIIGGCLWVAIFLLKVEAGLLETDPMENLTKIGGLVLRMGIAGVLLKNRNFFFGYFVAPIVEAGAGFVTMEGDEPVVSLGPDGGLRDATNALMTMATNAHNSAAALQGTGRWVKCLSKIHCLDLLFKIWFWDGGMFFSGCLMQFAGWLLIAVFPFFLVDAGFRLGIVAALCPLFIIAWVFESTRSYASKGLQAVLNIAFTFMLIRIAMAIAMKLIAASAGIDLDDAATMEKDQAACNYKSWNFTDGVCEQDVDAGTGNIFAIIIATAYGLLLLKNAAKELANYFSSTSFSNDTAFQAAKGGAQAVANAGHQAVMAGKAIQHGAERLKGSKLGQAISNSRVGRFMQERKERRQERISDIKEAIGDHARQGIMNTRNGIRGAFGLSSVQDMRLDRQNARTAKAEESAFRKDGAGQAVLDAKRGEHEEAARQALGKDENGQQRELNDQNIRTRRQELADQEKKAQETLKNKNATEAQRKEAEAQLKEVSTQRAALDAYQYPSQEAMQEAIEAERKEMGVRKFNAEAVLADRTASPEKREQAKQDLADIRAQERAIGQYEDGTERYNVRAGRDDSYYAERAEMRREREAERMEKRKDSWNQFRTGNASTVATPAPAAEPPAAEPPTVDPGWGEDTHPEAGD